MRAKFLWSSLGCFLGVSKIIGVDFQQRREALAG